MKDICLKGVGGMDEMKIRTAFMRKLIAGAVRKALRKKLGYEIDIQLNELSITFADAEMNKNELTKLIRKTGL